ncbi:hypothetical protein V6N12_065654 [Hibiscus sabdariffa]|uniref:Uncharacterized protein n=1 Tax=Hibiscus sabdariffa TaxID=183260 RepID=A0ABR2G9J4_9ROSI
MPPADPSEQAGNTEEVHFSANAKNDIFDWHTPMEHHTQPDAADIPKSSTAHKRKEPVPAEGEATPVTTIATITTTRRSGKTPAGRIIISDHPSSPKKAEQPPAKRQRRYHVITTDSDDDNSTGLPVAHPEQYEDPSLSYFLNIFCLLIFTPCISTACIKDNASLEFGGVLSQFCFHACKVKRS